MKPTGDFLTEYWQMRERIEWTNRAMEREPDVTQGKLLLAQFDEFYAQWRAHVPDAKLGDGLDALRRACEPLRNNLERIALLHLQEVIEARKDWWVAEKLFQVSVPFIKLMKECPPVMRPELEKVYRDHMGHDFDPTREFQDAERGANENQAAFRKALVAYEIDWPERVNAALRERLEQLDGEPANAWLAEVTAQLEKVGVDHAG